MTQGWHPREVTQAWAVIWPDGRMLADTSFNDEQHAWQVCLGWPDADEIEAAKRRGARAVRVTVVAPAS